MADITYRANLSSATFPFVSEYQGRTVIIPGPDNTYNRLVSSPDVGDRDAGIPQLFYCHNVLPTANGFSSVQYVIDLPTDSTGTRVIRILPWYNLAKEGLIGIRGVELVSCIDGSLWRTVGITLSASNTYRISKGTVNGETYLYFYNFETNTGICYTIDLVSSIATVVPLTGLSSAATGICAASGYLLAHTDTELAWSSTTDPTDFTPSLVTGAGSAQVQEVRGRMVCIQPAGFGAIIYSEVNAVAITYTGNARYPFAFEEIKGAGGAIDFFQPDRYIAADANSTSQFALTTNGLQILGPKSATRLLPELEDFLVSAYYEDFNEVTDTFTRIQYGPNGLLSFAIELNLVAARYFCLSYGPPNPGGDSPYTYMIVYDLALKRYGKLKIQHVSVFENLHQSSSVEPPYYANIGISDMTGQIVHPAIRYNSTIQAGVVILGKYQYVRSRMLALNLVTLENINASNRVTVSDLVAVDGKNTSLENGTLLESEGTQRVFSFNSVGTNHSLVIKGAFNLTSLILEFFAHGKA